MSSQPVMGSKGHDSKSVLDMCDLREPQNDQLEVSRRHLERCVGSSEGGWARGHRVLVINEASRG